MTAEKQVKWYAIGACTGLICFVAFMSYILGGEPPKTKIDSIPEETSKLKKLDSNRGISVYSYTDETGEYRVFVSNTSSYQPSAIKVK